MLVSEKKMLIPEYIVQARRESVMQRYHKFENVVSSAFSDVIAMTLKHFSLLIQTFM